MEVAVMALFPLLPSSKLEEEAVDRPSDYRARIATWSLLVLVVAVVGQTRA